MSQKFFISPFVNLRCLEGSVLAAGDEDLVEFEGGEALLLAAFASPRSCDEAARFLNDHGFDCNEDSVKTDMELLRAAGVLVDYDSEENYSRMQSGGGFTLYTASVLQQDLGHDASFSINAGESGGRELYTKEGKLIPLLPYPVAHWLDGYDLSSKNALVTTPAGLGWWSDSFVNVKVVKSDGLSAMQLASYPKGNVELISEFPESGSFDLIEIGPHRGEATDKATRALGCISNAGMILLRLPEWQPNALAVLRASGMIEINLAGFQPVSDAPRGCSAFLSRQFDWKQQTPGAAPVPTGGIAAPADLAKPPSMSLAPSARRSLRPSLRVPKK